MHLYLGLSPGGTMNIHEYAEETGAGEMMIDLKPGETFAGIPFELWERHAGRAVHLKDMRAECVKAFGHDGQGGVA
ncbi:MAG TPA: hypothetical protein VKA84_02955 [Gemmatimonadaceae bacterium]|nr:hypothetical protein [Gemmatimonadaceae bacterium]